MDDQGVVVSEHPLQIAVGADQFAESLPQKGKIEEDDQRRGGAGDTA